MRFSGKKTPAFTPQSYAVVLSIGEEVDCQDALDELYSKREVIIDEFLDELSFSKELTLLFQRGSQNVRCAIAKLLAQRKRLSPELQDCLLLAMVDENENVPRAAGNAFCEEQSQACADMLTSLLTHAHSHTRGSAIIALGKCSSLIEKIRPNLIQLALNDTDDWVRCIATTYLTDAKLSEDIGLPLFTKLLKDTDERVRQDAIESLLEYDRSKLVDKVPLIIDHINKSSGIYRFPRGLERLGPDVGKDLIPALLKYAGQNYNLMEKIFDLEGDISHCFPEIINGVEKGDIGACHVIDHIGAKGKDAVPALIKIISNKKWSDDYDLLMAAASALGAIGPDAFDSNPHLVRLVITGKGILVPNSARHALQNIGHTVATSVANGMKDNEVDEFSLARLACILKYFGRSASNTSSILQPFLKSSNFNTRLWASIALAHIIDEAEIDKAALVKAARDHKNPYAQFHALLALGHLRNISNESVPLIKGLRSHLTKSTSSIRNSNASEEASIDTRIEDAKLACLQQEEKCVLIACSIALLRLEKRAELISDLEQVLDNPSEWDLDLLMEAISALGEFGGGAKRSIDKINAIKHFNPQLIHASRIALEKLGSGNLLK